MAFSKIPAITAIILIFSLFTSGCTFSRQSYDTYDNSTYLVISNDSTVTLAGKYIVENDTYWIWIDPISNYNTYYNGFNITTQTNLPIDGNVLIRVYDTTIGAKSFGRYSETRNTTVRKGDRSYNNTLFHVNQFTLIASNYIVLISAGEKGPSNSTYFRIWPTP